MYARWSIFGVFLEYFCLVAGRGLGPGEAPARRRDESPTVAAQAEGELQHLGVHKMLDRGYEMNFRERRKAEVRPSVGLGVQDFSGSRAVTSRNTLLHNGATNTTWSPRFDSEGVPLCRCQVLATVHGGSLAMANFREYLFHALR
jgi:hypothetical protein